MNLFFMNFFRSITIGFILCRILDNFIEQSRSFFPLEHFCTPIFLLRNLLLRKATFSLFLSLFEKFNIDKEIERKSGSLFLYIFFYKEIINIIISYMYRLKPIILIDLTSILANFNKIIWPEWQNFNAW